MAFVNSDEMFAGRDLFLGFRLSAAPLAEASPDLPETAGKKGGGDGARIRYSSFISSNIARTDGAFLVSFLMLTSSSLLFAVFK